MTYTCTKCFETKGEPITALEHDWDDGVVKTPATCTEKGEMILSCKRDGCEKTSSKTLPMLEHTYKDGEIVTEATCTTAGVQKIVCSSCDFEGEIAIPANGHEFTTSHICDVCDAARFYIATIRSSGNYFYMTSNLGAASTKRYQAKDSGLTTLPESISAPEAGYVFVIESDGSISTEIEEEGVKSIKYLGWTSGNSGILVEKTDAKRFTIDKLAGGLYNIHFTASDGERYLSLNENAESNYFAFYKGTQKQDLSLVPVGDHTWVAGEEVDATCTENGSQAYSCACGETKTETIPATGHVNTTTETVGATCTENGYTKVTCDCGHVVSNTVIPATNHPNKTTTTVGATCTVDGSITVTCDDCGATISTETIPAPGHTEIVDNAVTATCTTAGKTEGKHCSVCNEVLVAQETVDALGHDMVTDNAVAPDCVNTGLTEGSHCSRCDHKVAQETVNALGHSYNSVVTAPTFDAQGYTTHTCIRGDHSYVDTYVPALVAVAKIGDARFETLQAALDAAKDGDVITLVADVQASKYLDVKTANNGEIARNFTLDLNGHDISPADGYNYNSGYSLIFVGINQTLTITGEGTITADKKVTVGVYGILNLVGGTIINKGTSDEDAALCIWHWDPEVDGDDYGQVVSGTGVVTGGTIKGDVYCEEGGAKLTVNVNENITLDQALAIGGTITLTKDVNYGEADFVIPSAVTINLNGHNITAAGVITFDTATRFVGEGKLVIPQDRIVLAGEADDIAVWVGDGYVFNQVKDQYKSEVTGDDSFNVVFRPSFGSTEYNEEILGGEINAGLTFELQIWNGETKLFAGTINAELVKQAYKNGGAISIRVKNAPAGTYTVKLVIKSSIGLINTAEFKTITIPAVEDAPAEAN